MRSVLIVSLLAAAAIMLAPEAIAKGPLSICGATACAPLGDERSVVGWQLGAYRLNARVAPAAPSPYFVLRFADYGGTIAYWVPSAGVLRVGDSDDTTWVAPRSVDLALLQTATSRLEPYAAPRTAKAAVDADLGKTVDMRFTRGGTSYLRLYTLGRAVQPALGSGGWLRIWVMGAPTPWTDGQNSLWISRHGALLRRDGTIVRIPSSVADRIRARAPLTG